MYQTTTSHSWPTAHIAVNRNRVKHYDKHVYLKGGTHFEIELFNPLSHKVMAKISIDGQQISTSGIVIKPGQRVFLERWLDTPKKFLFETYELDNSKEAKLAAWQNGIVNVQFFSEYIPTTTAIGTNYWGGNTFTTYPTYDNNFVYGATGPKGPSGTIGFLNTSLTTSNSLVMCSAGSLETGRTEMGAASGQSFSQDNGSYSSYASNEITIQILPESLKPVEVSEIRNYCSGCGTRIKKTSWKFCPSCGTEI